MPLCHSAWVPGCAADITALHVGWSRAATRPGALGRAGVGLVRQTATLPPLVSQRNFNYLKPEAG
jgi:hypothetical protein